MSDFTLDANALLKSVVADATAAGKQYLGERWEKFDDSERKQFTFTVTTMAKAKLAEASGHPEAKDIVDILTVAINEWKLAGATESLMAAKKVAETVLGITMSVGVPMLRKLVLGI